MQLPEGISNYDAYQLYPQIVYFIIIKLIFILFS